MKVEINISDLVSVEELQVLAAVLGCNSVDDNQPAFIGILSAAFLEYAEMMLGKHLPSRANEIRERRLLHILKFLYQDHLPSERDISVMFQLPESGSRSLLRNVRSKYRYDLEGLLVNTVKQTLITARELDNGNFRAVIQSENILEELQGVVAKEAPQLEQIKKVKDSARIYNIPVDTYDVLCDYYSINSEIASADDK